MSFIINVCRVLRNHHHLVRIYCYICVEISFLSIQTVAPKSCRHIIVHLITVVQLTCVNGLFTCHRIDDIETVECTLFIFVRLARQRFLPIQVRLDWIPIFIFCYFISFVSGKGRVSKTFSNNRILYPIHELLVFRIGYFGFVHPKTIYRNLSYGSFLSPKRVLTIYSHFEESTFHQCHTIGRRLRESSAAAHANHFSTATLRRGHLPAKAG